MNTQTSIKDVVDFFGGKQIDAAEKLEISQPHLSNLVRGIEKISPLLAKKIETKTNGAFKREQLRPDIFA